MNVKNVDILTIRKYFCLIKKKLQCYVCGKIISNPFTVRCGHSYCKNCIYELLYDKRNCPRCVTYPVIHYNVEENDKLHKVITQFKKLVVAFEADTNLSHFSQELFHHSHIAYEMDNLEHSRSTTSLQAQNSLSEILQSPARTNKNMVKEGNMRNFGYSGEVMVNTTPKNAPDGKSTSETEYFRRYRNITNRKNPIDSTSSLEQENVQKDQNLTEEKSLILSRHQSYRVESDEDLQNREEVVEEEQNLSKEKGQGHPSYESDLDESGENFTCEEEEEGEKEQNSAFYDSPTHSSLESDNLQNEEEAVEQNLSEEKSQGHLIHKSDLDGSGEEEEGEKEQISSFHDSPTHSSLESDNLQNEEEEVDLVEFDEDLQNREEVVEEEQNLSEEKGQGHPSFESDLDESGENFTCEEEEEEGEKEQNSSFHEPNIELHSEDERMIGFESFELFDSERYKSKRFDRFAASENMVSQSNTETEALEEPVIPLESYRKVSQRPRNTKSTIATENLSNFIETIESPSNSPLLVNKIPVNKSTPNFSGRINNNIRFIKLGKINEKKRKKLPFYYCGKLSRHSLSLSLDKNSLTILSPNQMRTTNLPKKIPVNRTLLDFDFQTSPENLSPETSPQVEENSHGRSVLTQTSQELLKKFVKELASKKRKLSPSNSDNEFSNDSDKTELLEDYYIRIMKNVDKGNSEIVTSRKRKFANTGFVSRVENSKTREIERIRDSVQEANICESFEVEKLFSFDKENQDPFNISEDRAQPVTEEHHQQRGPGIIEESDYVIFSSNDATIR